MAAVTVAGVSKRYGDILALDRVSVDFADGEFFGLLGPSGSGKTTLLRAIAGFVKPEHGGIAFAGEPIESVPVHRRNIGMVFQSYALFPHLNVLENVAFGLAVRGESKRGQRDRVAEMLDLVELRGFERRTPRQLSGGQRQRVALARALISRPRVLLLDEPLAALDKRLRQQMQIELKQLQKRLGVTTVFVTHDQEEALTLSDRIAIIDRGQVVQVGTPSEVYERPANVFAASFLGDANLLTGTVQTGGRLRLDDGSVLTADALPDAGERATVAVRQEKILLSGADDTLAPERVNRLAGRVEQAVYAGSSTTYLVRTADLVIKAFQQNREAQQISPGTPVTVAWPVADTIAVRG